MTASTLITVSGRHVDPLHLRVEDVSWIDIGHALAMLNRWNGHTSHPWSVAQHSIVVASIVEPEHTLWALLHDASEAYLTDVPRPLKRTGMFEGYRDAEDAAMAVILQAAGLPIGPMPDAVREADDAVLVAEARAFFPRRAFDRVGLPAVRESLVADASDWIRSDGGHDRRFVADRWKRMVLGLLRPEIRSLSCVRRAVEGVA